MSLKLSPIGKISTLVHECDAQKANVQEKRHAPEGKSVKILKEENQQYECVFPHSKQSLAQKEQPPTLFPSQVFSNSHGEKGTASIYSTLGGVGVPFGRKAFCTTCAFYGLALKGKGVSPYHQAPEDLCQGQRALQ